MASSIVWFVVFSDTRIVIIYPYTISTDIYTDETDETDDTDTCLFQHDLHTIDAPEWNNISSRVDSFLNLPLFLAVSFPFEREHRAIPLSDTRAYAFSMFNDDMKSDDLNKIQNIHKKKSSIPSKSAFVRCAKCLRDDGCV